MAACFSQAFLSLRLDKMGDEWLIEHLLVIHNLVSLCLHFGVLLVNETVQVLPIALFLCVLVGDLRLCLVFDLGFEVVQDCVLFQP